MTILPNLAGFVFDGSDTVAVDCLGTVPGT